MNKTLEKGKTLLVDGPAAVTILSGKAEIFSYPAVNPDKLIVREGKRLPFTAQKLTQLRISIGPKTAVKEVNATTIPVSWVKVTNVVKRINKRPAIIMVIGGVDSGKTSFCTYLTNRLINQNLKVTILDEDLGQSDIGPPGTVAYSHIVKPITDMFNLKEQNAIFVGTTSPSEAVNETIKAATTLKAEILRYGETDCVIVNTDGWITDKDAAQFKACLATALRIDAVLCLQNRNEIHSLCDIIKEVLPNCIQEVAESPFAVSQRNQEKRRSLRELSYAKYLENAKVRNFSIYSIEIKGNKAPIYNKRAENLIVGIYDAQGRFLGIGIIHKVDYIRRSIKIFTPVTEKPACIVVGKVRLNKDLHEISSELNPCSLPVKEVANLFGQ